MVAIHFGVIHIILANYSHLFYLLFKLFLWFINSVSRYIVVLSQKFPKIEFKELISLVEDISSNYEGCCEGDVVQCIRDTVNIL